MSEDALPEILVFTVFPDSHWQELASNSPVERVEKEMRRRIEVVGIFPNLSELDAWRTSRWPRSTTSGPIAVIA